MRLQITQAEVHFEKDIDILQKVKKQTSNLFLWSWQNTLGNQSREVGRKKLRVEERISDFEVFHDRFKICHGVSAETAKE